jgi:hypothetical protein
MKIDHLATLQTNCIYSSKRVFMTELKSKLHYVHFKNIFGGQYLNVSFPTHKQRLLCKSNVHNRIAMKTWDSNPGLLFLSWMRCPLRHATSEILEKHVQAHMHIVDTGSV